MIYDDDFNLRTANGCANLTLFAESHTRRYMKSHTIMQNKTLLSSKIKAGGTSLITRGGWFEMDMKTGIVSDIPVNKIDMGYYNLIVANGRGNPYSLVDVYKLRLDLQPKVALSAVDWESAKNLGMIEGMDSKRILMNHHAAIYYEKSKAASKPKTSLLHASPAKPNRSTFGLLTYTPASSTPASNPTLIVD